MSSDKIVWESIRWPDGSKYEGLTKDGRCEIRGVMTYADGSRYLGDYQENEMDGYGVYAFKSGGIYRGQWKDSMMHGCGVKLVKQPNGSMIAEEGEFFEDDWKHETKACSLKDARRAASNADIAAEMASVFQLDREWERGSVRKTKKAEQILKMLEKEKAKQKGFLSCLFDK